MAGKLLNSFQVSKGARVTCTNETDSDVRIKMESEQGGTKLIELAPLRTIAITVGSESINITILDSDQDTLDG